ncbi:MAG: 16S rRNA (cytidine(1402)-2'-O)-methyltransferase [Synergistaceae bacterium]|jgi:16S rRNA (cytidine1402-2'-O)-methyltransferase|nr:16S rRNA (cytidine(1402)-2'-O)-methyltransferase [Synergistaceae bacterium]
MPLFIVPTPIGNLGDVTLRALETLREADAIACEDTRRTLKLLNFYGIYKPLISYHRHNERSRTEEIMVRLKRGDRIALVSDAGTPGISDPGRVLISAAYARGVEVDALPGANSILPALLMSGIPAGKFFFAGFPEGGEAGISLYLAQLSHIRAALVFFVAPHDLARFLSEANGVFGCRQAALVREISKVHQESIRGTLSELIRVCDEREMKGEMVLVVEGAPEVDERAPAEDWQKLAMEMKKTGIWNKVIANVLFASYGIPRNQVKKFLSREESDIERER